MTVNNELGRMWKEAVKASICLHELTLKKTQDSYSWRRFEPRTFKIQRHLPEHSVKTTSAKLRECVEKLNLFCYQLLFYTFYWILRNLWKYSEEYNVGISWKIYNYEWILVIYIHSRQIHLEMSYPYTGISLYTTEAQLTTQHYMLTKRKTVRHGMDLQFFTWHRMP
jgi:hypothetical protein